MRKTNLGFSLIDFIDRTSILDDHRLLSDEKLSFVALSFDHLTFFFAFTDLFDQIVLFCAFVHGTAVN